MPHSMAMVPLKLHHLCKVQIMTDNCSKGSMDQVVSAVLAFRGPMNQVVEVAEVEFPLEELVEDLVAEAVGEEGGVEWVEMVPVDMAMVVNICMLLMPDTMEVTTWRIARFILPKSITTTETAAMTMMGTMVPNI